jgi:Uma2 family endonuclease
MTTIDIESLAEQAIARAEASPHTPYPFRVPMTEDEFILLTGEDIRAEWIDGETEFMAPVSDEHADLGGWLAALLRTYVDERKLGIVRGPEFTIRFAKQRRRRVPDVMFVSKERTHLITKNHLEGAPDLAIEIVSPDSQRRDWREKYSEYEKAGVREYWIIDPITKVFEPYRLGKSKKFEQITIVNGKLSSTVVQGFFLKAHWLVQRPLPNLLATLRELGIKM